MRITKGVPRRAFSMPQAEDSDQISGDFTLSGSIDRSRCRSRSGSYRQPLPLRPLRTQRSRQLAQCPDRPDAAGAGTLAAAGDDQFHPADRRILLSAPGARHPADAAQPAARFTGADSHLFHHGAGRHQSLRHRHQTLYREEDLLRRGLREGSGSLQILHDQKYPGEGSRPLLPHPHS